MPKLSPFVSPAASCLLLFCNVAFAQFTITNIVNSASRKGANIAQGGLFSVLGKGVGPASDPVQATFPLPTTDGLAGVTIQALASDGQIVNCIMVFVKPNEVAAILPSSTALGKATITVNNNGATASRDINVVETAFGIFTQNYGFGGGLANAFNINADGTTALNSNTLSVMPQQDLIINGTGLGAIPSDETQPGVTDVPTTPNVRIYVGTRPATVVSAGRGTCCDGIDPSYIVPQGIAAWDVVRFTVPDGVTGCNLPVVVQIGDQISNLAIVSIDPSGATCSKPPSTLPPELATAIAGQTGVSIGSVGLGREFSDRIAANGRRTATTVDSGAATFVQYPDLPASMLTPYIRYAENVCTVGGYPDANGNYTKDGQVVPIIPLKSAPLDAGTPIVVKGPSGSRNIVKRTVANVFDYPGVNFGNGTPGNFFDPGVYTITDAAGGRNVGSFTATITVPDERFVWQNPPDITQLLDRSQDLVVNWTGGMPGQQVVVEGGSFANGSAQAFLCAAAAEAGTLTIPSYVLLQLAPTGNSILEGSLIVNNFKRILFPAKGLDWGVVSYGVGYHLALKWK